jgi:hypothetical protein
MKKQIGLLLLVAGCALGLGTAGCDDVDDEFDYVPPAGRGALIVENNTASDINLYLDGASRGEVDDDSYLPVDAIPGVYRVVLDEDDGDRSYGADVDIMEGRLTILRVYIDSGDYTEYRVRIEFE